MRLLDTYATNTGSTIDKPYIYTKFFPCPEKKYIVIQAQTPYDSRNYSFWQEVIDIINPELSGHDIEIVQIGLNGENQLANVTSYIGKTDIHQLSFVIQNSILYFGADSLSVHLASYSNKPIVALYSISNPNVAGPHFGEKSKHVLLKAYENIGTKKPSYSQQESPKSIDTIKPEEIANAIFNMLNIKAKKNITSLHFGSKFREKIIDFIPDTVIRPDFAKDAAINMRLDMAKNDINENFTIQNFKIRPFNLFITKSKKPTSSIQFFEVFRQNILNVFINVTDELPDINYIKDIISTGKKPIILYEGDDIDYINNIKLDLLEFNLIFLILNSKSNLSLDSFDNVKIKTNRIILSNGKIFLSKQHMYENIPASGPVIEANKIKNIQALQEELEFFYIYKEENSYV